MANANATETPKNFVSDQRGAIMVMGIFLACSMIAAMWYMMGIGDAILWRDRQQEAADSIAFTSAAIHARGMNFIAMINIIMLLIVMLYLILCIVRTVLDLILYISGDDTVGWCIPFGLKETKGHGAITLVSQIVSGFASGNPPRYGGFKCGGKGSIEQFFETFGNLEAELGDNSGGRDLMLACKTCGGLPACLTPVWGLECVAADCIAEHKMHDIASKVGPWYDRVEGWITKWEKVMQKVMPELHVVEVASAVVVPYVAAGVSIYAGTRYKDVPSQEPTNQISHKGVAISPSMLRKLKKPQQVKVLRDDLDWIPCANQVGCGNGCGPTLCGDGKVSRSGWKKNGTSGTTAECCAPNQAGCNQGGTCSGHGGVAGNQDGLYMTRTIDDSRDYRIGLPVQAENMNELCQKAFSYIGDVIEGAMQGIIGGSGASGTSTDGEWMTKSSGNKAKGGGSTQSVSGLMGQLFDMAGGFFKKAYCTFDPAFSAAHSTDGSYDDVFPGKNGHYDGSCSAVCSGGCPDGANDFWAINPTDRCPFMGKLGHDWSILGFNGDHGGGNGPMKVADYAYNGGDYMQVYSIVLNDNYNPLKGEYGTSNTQTAWSKIRLGVGPAKWSSADDTSGIIADEGGLSTVTAALVGGNGNGPWFYFAEAEFYHDCESGWTDNSCNGGDHAMYRLNWRTRLRRVHQPIFMKDLTSKIPGFINKISGFVSSHQWEINNFASTYIGVDLSTILNDFELLSELGNSNAAGLMVPIYH